MSKYKVTFKFTKLPYYMITGIEAADKNQALNIARKQMILEIGICARQGYNTRAELISIVKSAIAGV